MKYMIPGIVAAAITFGIVAAAVANTPAPYVGQWIQRSEGQELVLTSRVKLQPNVGVGAGTSLGGSVGYGSMTRTAIVTEPIAVHVARSMSLKIGVDGSFEWTISRRYTDDAGCTRSTTRVKRGTVQATGNAIEFAIAEGNEAWRSSCGKQGEDKIAATTERYAMTAEGKTLRLSSGPVSWTFDRG